MDNETILGVLKSLRSDFKVVGDKVDKVNNYVRETIPVHTNEIKNIKEDSEKLEKKIDDTSKDLLTKLESKSKDDSNARWKIATLTTLVICSVLGSVVAILLN